MFDIFVIFFTAAFWVWAASIMNFSTELTLISDIAPVNLVTAQLFASIHKCSRTASNASDDILAMPAINVRHSFHDCLNLRLLFVHKTNSINNKTF